MVNYRAGDWGYFLRQQDVQQSGHFGGVHSVVLTDTPGRMPDVADKHSAAFWVGGAALIAGGGIFMAVTGFEPTETPGTVWANSWFDLGFAFVILGLVITGFGVVMHLRREVQPGSAPPAVSATNGPPTATPAPPTPNPPRFRAQPSNRSQPRRSQPPGEAVNPGPLLLTVEDEVWDLWRRAGYICALLLKITNTTGRAITVINYGVGPTGSVARLTPRWRSAMRVSSLSAVKREPGSARTITALRCRAHHANQAGCDVSRAA